MKHFFLLSKIHLLSLVMLLFLYYNYSFPQTTAILHGNLFTGDDDGWKLWCPPGQTTGYDASKIRHTLDEMVEYGMNKLIIRSIGTIDSIDFSYVPSFDDNTLAYILQYAYDRNIEVYIGLVFDPRLGDITTAYTSPYWESPQCDSIAKFCGQIGRSIKKQLTSGAEYNLAAQSIAGFYIPEDLGIGYQYQDMLSMTSFYASIVDTIHNIFPETTSNDPNIRYRKKNVILTGYFDALKYGSIPPNTSILRPSDMQTWLSTFLQDTHPDIFLLQDGVGSFDTPTDKMLGNLLYQDDYIAKGRPNLEDYLAACSTVCKNQNVKFWIEPELFESNFITPHLLIESDLHGIYLPSIISQVKKQINVAAQYADALIGCDVQAWMSDASLTVNPDRDPDNICIKAAAHLKRGYMAAFRNQGKIFNYWYTYHDSSLKPDTSYNDEYISKLNDQKVTSVRWFPDINDDWVGFKTSTNEKVIFIADILETNYVSDITIVAKSRIDQNIEYPNNGSIVAYVSEGGTYWTRLDPTNATSFINAVSDNQSKVYFSISSATPQRARYVKIEVTPRPGKYLMLGEVEIYGGIAPVGKQNGAMIKRTRFDLVQNYPNPFNPSTTISYSIPEKDFVSVKVFNTLGQEITTLVNEVVDAGTHSIDFDGSSLPSGMYIYQIQTSKMSQAKKMLLVK